MNKTNKYWYERLNEDFRKDAIKKDQKRFLKIIIVVSVITAILFTATAKGQTHYDRSFTANTTQLVSPNINLDQHHATGTVSMKQASAYYNLPIESRHDIFMIGGGYKYSDTRNFSNPEFYVGRLGSTNDKFRMSLIFGAYRVNSDGVSLTTSGTPFNRRRASYAGASLTYHVNETTYFGATVRDIYDVAWTDGDSDTFKLYEGMTPTIFSNVAVFDNNFETVSLYTQASINPEEGLKYTISAEFKAENMKAGVFYSNEKPGVFISVDFGMFSPYMSYCKEFAVGLKITEL